MTLSAKNHGYWVPYQPDKAPEGHPANAMYCQRESDRIDWYEYQARKPFAADTVKMTLLIGGARKQHIVQAANRDASAIFPQNCMLIEVSGSDAADPQKEYGGKEYNPDAADWDPNTPMFSELPPPMMTVNDRQFYQELALRRLITKQEALTAVRTGVVPKVLQDVLNTLPPDDQFDAEMWLAGNALDRNYWLMDRFRTALGLTDAEFDDLWRHAMTLGTAPPPQ